MREFSLLGFIEHIAVVAVEVVHAEQHALERGAQIIEKEAKDSLGHYQPQSGPFDAWDELADFTKDDRLKQGYPEDEPELRSGRMGGTIEHTVMPHQAEIGSDDEILEMQELGTEHMPPRSILGGAAARKADEVAELLGEEVVAALIGAEVFQGRLAIR
jgi:hypothetical protein